MTASYTAGTVSVTAGSDIVTGSGTGWLASNISPGYFGLDSSNGNPVPVLEVLSDTSMRLVKPWRGTTASGQGYWLSYDTRDGQQTVNNAQRLSEYIALLRSSFFSAFAGITPAANSIPYFGSGAVAALSSITALGRSIIGASSGGNVYSALGVIGNSQLPERIRSSGVELTAADDLNSLPNESGFYHWGAPAPANAPDTYSVMVQIVRSSSNAAQIVFDRNGIPYSRSKSSGIWGLYSTFVGPVGVSGGKPTGSVMERGSNANGEYVKFADGTMIAWTRMQITPAVADWTQIRTEVQMFYLPTTVDWIFPVSFKETPVTNATSDYFTWMRSASGFNTSKCRYELVRETAQSRTYNLAYIAVGRWF